MTGWLTPPPPWDAYCALVEFRLVALDKKPGVRPVRRGEMLCRALTKLVVRASGYLMNTACGNIHLCSGLEDVIEGATHNVVQRRLKRVRRRGRDEKEAVNSEE